MSSAAAFVEACESPAYVYDLADIRRAYAELRAALPEPSVIYYSLKANPHPAVVAELRTAGCRAEVSSPGELRAAREAGFEPVEILYSGPGKRDVDVRDALAAGVALFSVDSPHALDQLARAAGQRVVRSLLRVNDAGPAHAQGLTMTGGPSQFGADREWVLAEPERFAHRPPVCAAGFHLYAGTNLADEDALMDQFTHAAAAARGLAEATGIELAIVDLGGGFGAPFARCGRRPRFPHLRERLGAMLDVTFPGWRRGAPMIAFESGRYLTAGCGTLVTRVLDVKRSRGRPVVVLDSGINHLGGMSGLRRLPPIAPDLLALDGADEPLTDVIVAGPLCTPTDSWSRSATLAPVRPGQLVGVPNVGAYGLSASLVAFLGHPPAAEIAVDGERVVDVSRLELRRTPLPFPPRS